MAIEDGAGGAKTFTISRYQEITIQNFGAFGEGNVPANAAELDTLVFDDPDLRVENMTMTQQGTSVVVSFTNPPFDLTKVTLENTTIARLENIGALGNFKFFGESAVTDSLDVWDAAQVDNRIRHWDTLTFLNNLDNHVIGLGSGDVIHALDGDDEIDGRSGDDVIRGGDGNDRLVGGIGIDTLYGDAGDDRLEGGRGNDLLDGGTGNDVMIGGKGDDIYIVDSAGDTVIEDINSSRGGGWVDAVQSSVSFDLALHEKIENLTLTGTGHVDGTGNIKANVIIGNEGDNTLKGGGGNDMLVGNGGKDSFQGGSGDDLIVLGPGESVQVDGGTGFDIVNANNFSGPLDLTGALSGLFKNIETLDLDQVQSNVAILDSASIVAMTGANGGAIGPNTLLIKGDPGDGLRLTDEGWERGDQVENPFGQTGTFVTWTNGAVTALIGTSVDVFESGRVDLADVSADEGFGIAGARRINAAGDINADGIDDFVLNGSAVIFGQADGFTNIDLSAITPDQGFVLTRSGTSGDPAGLGGGSDAAGDFNGDGIDDIIVAATRADTANGIDAGEAYVVFGTPGGPGNVDVTTMTAAQGYKISGAAANDGIGSVVTSAGDFNGDGVDDILINARIASPYGRIQAGESYLIYGKLGGSGDIDLAALTPAQGFKMAGEDIFHHSGEALSSAGDINGDGYDDIIVGAPYLGSGVGRGYVIYGTASAPGNIDLAAALAAGQGFTISGSGDDDFLARSVDGAGDINGDGVEDIVISEYRGGVGGSGLVYVVYGREAGFGSHLDLTTLTNAEGFKILGFEENSFTGRWVSSAGDVNGDGVDDVIVGAPDVDTPGASDAGQAYVIYGKEGGLGDIDLANVKASQGFTIDGAGRRDYTGMMVSGLDDINGDGFADVGVSVPYGETGPRSFVLYGGDLTSSVTHQGTSSDDALTGTVAADTFVGGLGNDILTGGGGADASHGGAGDDAIHVADGGFKKVEGGNGSDSLHVDFDGTIDLGNIDGKAATTDQARIRSIETIDTDNGFTNQITLHLADVLHIDPENHDFGGVADLDAVLTIDGDTGDSLALDPADGWTADASALPGYVVYTAGAVKVAVDEDITVAFA